MPTITYIESNGTARKVQLHVGKSIMQGAVDNMIEGILAECGGCCSCATCHCYIDDAWFEKLQEPSANELAMLECVVERRPNSRLGCQVIVDNSLDGAIIQMPKSQY